MVFLINRKHPVCHTLCKKKLCYMQSQVLANKSTSQGNKTRTSQGLHDSCEGLQALTYDQARAT